jgi:CheY-like chemotaxis protein
MNSALEFYGMVRAVADNADRKRLHAAWIPMAHDFDALARSHARHVRPGSHLFVLFIAFSSRRGGARNGATGTEFLHLVRTRDSKPKPLVPIIALTAHSERSRAPEAWDAGATEFLCKPVSAEALCGRILDILLGPRAFVPAARFFGPDRRRPAADSFPGLGCRNGDRRPPKEARGGDGTRPAPDCAGSAHNDTGRKEPNRSDPPAPVPGTTSGHDRTTPVRIPQPHPLPWLARAVRDRRV